MHGSSTPRLIAAVFVVSFSGCIVQQAPPKNQQQPEPAQAPQPQKQAVAQNTKPAATTKPAVAPTPAPKQSAPTPVAPAPVGPAPTAPAAGRTYTIKPGDNLWNISKEVYGDGTKYQRIIDANPGINPDNMKPGTKIVIP